METMKISEKRRSSKGVIIGLLIFFLIGGTIIYLAIRNEKAPKIIGDSQTEVDRLVNLENNVKEKEENKNKTDIDNLSKLSYTISDKKITDKTNKKIKGDLVLPVISINGEELIELNTRIYEKYNSAFETSKNTLKEVDNKYTFKVTYNAYENVIDGQKILSVTIYQRTIDDVSRKEVTEKVDTYNIDMEKKALVDEKQIATTLLGKDYKIKIQKAAKDYTISKNMIKEEEFVYAVTGLENFYIKDLEFHVFFNHGELVDEKYGMIDIVVK